MPRGPLILILILVILVGGAVWLSGRNHQVPTHPIEVDVPSAPAR